MGNKLEQILNEVNKFIDVNDYDKVDKVYIKFYRNKLFNFYLFKNNKLFNKYYFVVKYIHGEVKQFKLSYEQKELLKYNINDLNCFLKNKLD